MRFCALMTRGALLGNTLLVWLDYKPTSQLLCPNSLLNQIGWSTMESLSVNNRAGTDTPSDEYDSYREYRVANTNMYSRIQ